MNARVLLFTLGGECYAIDLDPIESILPEAPVDSIPMQPACLEGFFRHEGECLPAVSLRKLLGSARSQERQGGKMLVVRHHGFRLAFRVDAVLGTRRSEELREGEFILLSLESLLADHSRIPAEADA